MSDAQRIAEYVTERFDAVLRRFFGGDVQPRFLAGHPIGPDAVADLIRCLGALHELGVQRVAGRAVTDWISQFLRTIDGPATRTFGSFRVAETLLLWGKFADNPLLAGFTPAQRDNVAAACDSTAILVPLREGKLAANYWGVLARCETARRALGLPIDEAALDEAVERFTAILFRNELGYFDDGAAGGVGRYDIYSFDVCLFSEPFWDRLPADKLRHVLQTHARLLERIAMENGASVAWGRSIGALSLCMTMEMGAVSLREGLATDPSRVRALIRHAFEQFKGWIDDDLIAAHRGRMTFAYRGPHRLLQMTVDCLDKLAYVARTLPASEARSHPEPQMEPAMEPLFPLCDEFIPFAPPGPADGRPHCPGVWMFRNEHLAFQLPLVSSYSGADYAAYPHVPGLFENPVGSRLFGWSPMVLHRGNLCICGDPPVEARKFDAGLEATWDGFQTIAPPGWTQGNPADASPGRRTACFRVEGAIIHVEETWTFDQIPDGITINIFETADRPLIVDVLECSSALSRDTVVVDGIGMYQSFWRQLARVHEVHIAPAAQVRLHYAVRLIPRVTVIPGNHDYTQALYNAAPPGALKLAPRPQHRPVSEANLRQIVGDTDVLHVGWPEHLFVRGEMSDEQWLECHAAFLRELGASGIKVVWTMHNRRPHHWPQDAGRALYHAWAGVADLVIHHSHWGMDLMRRELPYKPTARHVVFPHGHYGRQLPPPLPRAELERQLGLPPCAIRIGVVGRYQKEKRIDMTMAAFAACRRDDLQFLAAAINADTPVPDDLRIVPLRRTTWLSREQIARQTEACDVLISAPEGGSYLTSGIVADAVGAGKALIVSDWPFFRELLGDAGLYFDGTQAGLTALFDRLTVEDVQRSAAAMTALQQPHDWSRIAAGLTPLIYDLAGVGCGGGVKEGKVGAVGFEPTKA